MDACDGRAKKDDRMLGEPQITSIISVEDILGAYTTFGAYYPSSSTKSMKRKGEFSFSRRLPDYPKAEV